MSARSLTGKEPAEALLDSLKQDVAALDPQLVIIQVGNDPASDSYIRKKMESAQRIGMRHRHVHLAADTAAEEVAAQIDALNADTDVSGMILQLPLPDALWKVQPQLTKRIDPMKDVDGFTAYNLGKMMLSTEFEHLPPATPAGIMLLLEHYGISVAGKQCVVVGRSNIVGKPLAMMLLNRDATVTVCHSKTPHIAGFTRHADILFSAVGQKDLISKDMIKEGAVVIDIGMTRSDEGIVGDCSADVREVASAITPVPGGVGPMTVASLLRNCVRAKRRQMEARQ